MRRNTQRKVRAVSEEGQYKKKSADQTLVYHDTFKSEYKPAAWTPQENSKIRRIMNEKPQDRRLLTRYLIAEKVGQRLVDVKELEERGLIEIKKSDIIEKMNRDIRKILRGE